MVYREWYGHEIQVGADVQDRDKNYIQLRRSGIAIVWAQASARIQALCGKVRLTSWIRIDLPLSMKWPALEEYHANSSDVGSSNQDPRHFDSNVHLLDTVTVAGCKHHLNNAHGRARVITYVMRE